MTDLDRAKDQAAKDAATLVEDGMTVGLGSGSTAALVIRHLAERVRAEGLRLVGAATSEGTAELARSLGLTLRALDDLDELDLDLDGADEVDPQFRMIKGRGGALLREKIVASAARRRLIVITASKRVDQLGRTMPVPVEVSDFGTRHTERGLRALGAEPSTRLREDGSPWITDGGNRIIDCRFPTIDDPDDLDRRLRRVVGVLETGLFLGLCDTLIVGHPDRVERIERPASR